MLSKHFYIAFACIFFTASIKPDNESLATVSCVGQGKISRVISRGRPPTPGSNLNATALQRKTAGLPYYDCQDATPSKKDCTWQYISKYCKAPDNGTCSVIVQMNGKTAECDAAEGSVCTASIKVPGDSKKVEHRSKFNGILIVKLRNGLFIRSVSLPLKPLPYLFIDHFIDYIRVLYRHSPPTVREGPGRNGPECAYLKWLR